MDAKFLDCGPNWFVYGCFSLRALVDGGRDAKFCVSTIAGTVVVIGCA